jgi:hypothetical protein
VVLLGAIVLTSCQSSPAASPSLTGATPTPPAASEMIPTLIVELDDFVCLTGSTSDISEGTQVTVSDGSGTIHAADHLRRAPGQCRYTVVFHNVPALAIYSLTVGGHDPVVLSRTELEAEGWNVTVALDVHGVLSVP